MNTALGWIEFWNRKVKQFTIWDLKLVQIWTAAWVLLLVKIFPQIMHLSLGWFVGVIALCAPYLVYIVFYRSDDQSAAPRAVDSPGP